MSPFLYINGNDDAKATAISPKTAELKMLKIELLTLYHTIPTFNNPVK